MNALAHTLAEAETEFQEATTVQTTLYDLIDAIRSVIHPGEEHLISSTVFHLLSFGKIKIINELKEFPAGLSVVRRSDTRWI
jgi:hypothetical protein